MAASATRQIDCGVGLGARAASNRLTRISPAGPPRGPGRRTRATCTPVEYRAEVSKETNLSQGSWRPRFPQLRCQAARDEQGDLFKLKKKIEHQNYSETPKLRKNYAEITQKLRTDYAEIMQIKLCRNYANYA